MCVLRIQGSLFSDLPGCVLTCCSPVQPPLGLLYMHSLLCKYTRICLGSDRVFEYARAICVIPWLNFQNLAPLGRMELMVLYYLTAHDIVTVSAPVNAKGGLHTAA